LLDALAEPELEEVEEPLVMFMFLDVDEFDVEFGGVCKELKVACGEKGEKSRAGEAGKASHPVTNLKQQRSTDILYIVQHMLVGGYG
jgi:hypothetical protein